MVGVSMAHLAPHQDPWFHDVFHGPGARPALGESIALVATPRVGWLRRCVALVTADRGYWREERLVEGLDGSVVMEIDSHRGEAPHREPLPPELAGEYDRLVAYLKGAARAWACAEGLYREPGAARGETIVMLEAATLEGRALLGESAVRAFRRVVFPGLDVAAMRR